MSNSRQGIDPNRIKEALDRLRSADNNNRIFGSEAHRYRLNPALTNDELRIFETQYCVRLPQDYRDFLFHVGNGGAGPYYGLYSLNESIKEARVEDGVVLSQPFPRSAYWNLSDDEWAAAPQMPDDPTDLEEERFWEEFTPWRNLSCFSPQLTHGSIPICHYGCGLYFLLIISGSERGTVWMDDRVNDEGIYPMTIDRDERHWSVPDLTDTRSNRITFSQWYNFWLDRSLSEIETPVHPSAT